MSISSEQQTLLDELFAAIDAKDTERFLAYLRNDAEFRFGSAPPARGKAAIGEAVSGFFDSISGLRHAVTASLATDDTLVCEGEVTYTRHDDSKITLPFADVFELDDGLIANYKIYMEIGPLFAS